MRFIPKEVCDTIVHLHHNEKLKTSEIIKSLSEEGITVGATGVRGVIQRFKETGSVAHRKRCGRTRTYGDEIRTQLDEIYRNNQETTSTDAKRILREKGICSNGLCLAECLAHLEYINIIRFNLALKLYVNVMHS